MLEDPRILGRLRDPGDGSSFVRIEGDRMIFAGGRSYPIHRGIPVLIDERESVFSVRDVLDEVSTTQRLDYRKPDRLKNLVRQRVLPSLSKDRSLDARYAELASAAAGEMVLVIGCGDKADEYCRRFPKSELVTSDVHCLFDVDLVFDGHAIPFCDETFGLVLVPQVLEHTSRPWVVASELQRVTKVGGTLQVEVPFGFPCHGLPYDFYRFTPSALRLLFPRCRITRLEATEKTWSAAAVTLSAALIDSLANRWLRMAALAVGRLGLWWLKYLDRWISTPTATMPKGYAVTYVVDGKSRTEKELLAEVTNPPWLARPERGQIDGG